MVVTLTANPAIDKTASVEQLRPGELNRLFDVTVDYAGKGVNVSRVVHMLGGRTIATGLLGRDNAEAMKRSLDKFGVAHDFTLIDGAVRTNLKILSADGALTEINEPGISSNKEDWALLEATLMRYAKPDSAFALSGSLPPGAPKDTYKRLAENLKKNGATVIVDADSDAFRAAMEVPPDIVKPNRYELTQYFGISGDPDIETLLALCKKLIARGVSLVALSMGGDGALFCDKEKAYRAPGLSVDAHSPVGAGDSMVAALAYGAAERLPLEDTATLAMAVSAAAVTTTGTKPPPREAVERLKKKVKLENI